MKHRGSNDWLWPPPDQWLAVWGLLVLVGLTFLGNKVLFFFMGLTSGTWLWFYALTLSVATLGAALIFYAKLPLYRRRRFFTFGIRVLPEERQPFYRWGYRFAILGIAVLACLLLSRH